MKPDQNIGRWPQGMDTVAAATALAATALRDAVNVDIDRAGRVTRRAGRTLALTLPGAHSLRTTSQGTLVVAASVLYRLDGGAAVPLAALGSDDACDYAELDAAVVVSNRASLLCVTAAGARALGLPAPAAPIATAAVAGGLHAGRYAVAVALQRADGEAGPLSQLAWATIGEGQGIQLAALPTSVEAVRVRVYRTQCDGDALYHCDDVPVGVATWTLGTGQLGKLAPFAYTARMLPGAYATTWGGRLLTARGRTVTWSEPLAYGLTRPGHNQLQAPHRITMLSAVDAGVFIGTTRGVWLLRGTAPKDAQWQRLAAPVPLAGCYAVAAGDTLDPKLNLSGRRVLVWLSADGLVLGTPDGNAIALQATRLQNLGSGSGALVQHGRRLSAVLK